VSFENDNAVALGLLFVYFWTKKNKTRQNKQQQQKKKNNKKTKLERAFQQSGEKRKPNWRLSHSRFRAP